MYVYLILEIDFFLAEAPVPDIGFEVSPGKSIRLRPNPSIWPLLRFFGLSRLRARPLFLPCWDTPAIDFHRVEASF